MKIGIFGDVHGHLAELQQTLALLRRHQVDEIICLGDLVDKGIHSDAVVQLMLQQAIPCVQGNHDAKVRFAWLTDREPLQDSSLTYLLHLPPTLTFQWAGKTAYVAHANPWEDSSIYVFPTRPMALFQEVIRDVSADVIILGHTHHPMRVEVDRQIIVNPGSIYGNRDRLERTCGILSLPDCTFEIYDIDTGKQLAL
jgi:putative phosphoesterase